MSGRAPPQKSTKVEWLGVAALVIFVVGMVALLGSYFGPRAYALIVPPDPTPIAANYTRVVQGQEEVRADCAPMPHGLPDPQSSLTRYSALTVMNEMGLVPGLSERTDISDISFAWVVLEDGSLRYTVWVEDFSRFEFVVDCFTEVGDELIVVFKTVEVFPEVSE